MILQYRVQDYNLQRCSIASVIPDSDSLKKQNRELHFLKDSMYLDIWMLDASAGELDLTTLSWNTLPKRKGFLSSLLVQKNRHTHTREFECAPASTLMIFELSCPEDATEECAIEFWQEQPETDPRMGEQLLYITCHIHSD